MREIIKRICHNAIGSDDPFLKENDAKWLIAYMWWIRDLENEDVNLSQFNQNMSEHINSI